MQLIFGKKLLLLLLLLLLGQQIKGGERNREGPF